MAWTLHQVVDGCPLGDLVGDYRCQCFGRNDALDREVSQGTDVYPLSGYVTNCPSEKDIIIISK